MAPWYVSPRSPLSSLRPLQTQVHEIGYAECSKSYVFRGGKEYTPKQIQDMLGLGTTARAAPRPGQSMPQQAFGAARFLLPVQQCEFQFSGILETLARDPWPVANDKRPLRCTGVALSVAVGLLEVSVLSLTLLLADNSLSDDIP
jgi:protein transport protein SEC23